MTGIPGKHVLKWRLRGLLKLFPMRHPGPDPQPISGNSPRPLRIAYLFSGTYGDFVQALHPLNRLVEVYPGCDLVLYGAHRYAREFSPELPTCLRTAAPLELCAWIFARRDLLFTNAVGVYRVSFEYIAYFCARRSYGFRHAAETRRAGYLDTLALLPTLQSFADANLKVLELAGLPVSLPVTTRSQGEDTGIPFKAREPADSQERILFHIGSSGLKRDFGLKVYTRLVLGILNQLEGKPVEVVMGPGDEDIALEVKTGSTFVPQMFPMVRLIPLVRSFEGSILCFNSFLAHLCVYVNRPAIVIHRHAVPFGYDCSPIHRQVILKAETGYDLSELWETLDLKKPLKGVP